MTTATEIVGAFDGSLMVKLEAEAAQAIAYARQNRPQSAEGRAGGNFPARHLSYWRLCSRPECRISGHVMRRGWLTVGPSPITRHGEQEVTAFERGKHATRLGQYGDWSTYERDDNFSTMYFSTYKPDFPFGEFETLMTLPGGVREFPISQIRQLRWHHNAFIRSVRPDACTEEDYPCSFCPENFPEPAHLQNHVHIIHPEQSSVMALGNQINRPIDALISALSQRELGQDSNAMLAQSFTLLAALADRLGVNLQPRPDSPVADLYEDAPVEFSDLTSAGQTTEIELPQVVEAYKNPAIKKARADSAFTPLPKE